MASRPYVRGIRPVTPSSDPNFVDTELKKVQIAMNAIQLLAGPTGPAGPTGATGPAGSDASVTNTNVNTAIAADPTSSLAALGIVVGSYTPTATGVTNVASATGQPSSYVQIGSFVIVFATVTVTATTASIDTVVRASLPVTSSTTALSGVGAANTSQPTKPAGPIKSSAGVAQYRFTPGNLAATDQLLVFGYPITP